MLLFGKRGRKSMQYFPSPKLISLGLLLASFFAACDPTSSGKGTNFDPVVSDSCATAHNLDPKLILGRTKDPIFAFGGFGDSIFWRTESVAFVWHEGKTDTFPGQGNY